MKIYLKEKGSLFLTFTFFYLLIEFVTFQWVEFSILPESFLIDFLFIIIFGSGVFLFRSNKLSIVYITFILGLVMTVFLINATMYSVYFDLFTLQQLTLLGEAASVFNFEFLSIPSIIVATVIAFLYFLTLTLLWRKMFRYYEVIPNYYKKTLIVMSALLVFVSVFFISGIKSVKRFNNALYVTTFKRASLEQYGLLGYYYKEAKSIFAGVLMSSQANNGDNIIPVMDSLPTDYFGLLPGANVLTIMVESLQGFAVSEDLTPNLYRMTQEGLYFANNYSENKTNYSEMIGITGNYPTITLKPNSYEYDFTHSLPTILNNKFGYTTAYYHDNVGSFYSRQNLMGPMGFENSYFHDDLFPGMKMWTWNGDYTLDSVTVEEVIDNSNFNDEPFYYFWSTLSMHGPYYYGPKNKELFEDLGYYQRIDEAVLHGSWVNPLENGAEADRLRLRHYEAAVMDFDIALGRLLYELEVNDALENTIIVLYGDHNVYYHNLHLEIHDAEASEYYNVDLYDSFLAIYNPILTEAYLENNETNVIDKFTSPHVIVPTLFDLLGLVYNQNIMLSDSVFSDSMHVFYSNKLTAFFTDKVYSNDGYDIIYSKEEIDLLYEEEFFRVCEEHRRRLDIINYWYDVTKEYSR
jgi:phosphoglycerol transferase MdoB-like AlkP superfamily enzyme